MRVLTFDVPPQEVRISNIPTFPTNVYQTMCHYKSKPKSQCDNSRFKLLQHHQCNSSQITQQTNATTKCINYNSVPKHSCFHEYMTRTIEKLCFSFQILTKDSVTVFVDAIMYYKVVLMNRKYADFFSF